MITPNEPQRRQRRRTLTDLQVKNLPAKRKRYTLPDPEQRGLYVRVAPNGSKSFVAVARDPHGAQIWTTIGGTELGVEEARERARLAIKRVKEGKPAKEPLPVKPDSFRSVAENWLGRHVAKKKLRTAPEIERILTKYVFPTWADREFATLGRGDIAKLLDRVEDHHGPRQADAVLEVVRSVAGWFATRNDDYVPPFVRGMRRHGKKARDRILDDDELRAVWKQAETGGSFGALIRLLLLTGQRRGAVLRMRWDNISTDGVWEIPTGEREKSHVGSVRLPAQALSIIVKQPRIARNPFVFAGARGNGPMNGFSKPKLAFDRRCGVTGWTLHDLRRTARSLMSRAGVPSEHAERTLGHTIAGVEGVYDRHAYFEEKSAALAKLAALIGEILHGTPSKVVKLKPKARTDA